MIRGDRPAVEIEGIEVTPEMIEAAESVGCCELDDAGLRGQARGDFYARVYAAMKAAEHPSDPNPLPTQSSEWSDRKHTNLDR